MKAIKLFGLRNYTIGNKVLLPINPNQIKTIAVDFNYDVTERDFKNWQFIFGSRIISTNMAFSCIIRYDRLWLNIGSIDKTTDIPISLGKHHIEYTNDFDKKICSINFDNKYTINAAITEYSNNTISLYTVTDKNQSTETQTFLGTIYKIHIVKTDNTSTDFVPALYDGKLGFIDELLLGTDISSDKFYAETIGGLRIVTLDFSKVTSLQIPEGNVTKIQDKEGNILWANINKVAYGVRWNSVNQATTACERIGNLELHKTLPIQSRFKVCIHKGKEIQYYCNPDDSRFRQDNTGYVKTLPIVLLSEVQPAIIEDTDTTVKIRHTITDDIFADYKYLYAFIKVYTDNTTGNVCRITKINTTNKTAYLESNHIFDSGDYSVELGCSINGYDGEIGVDTGGKFYQWSVDNDGDDNEVWQSLYKCVPYAREIKRHIIGIDRACVLNVAFNDTKWGWIGGLGANTAVNVINYHTNLRGGSDTTTFDEYLGVDNFRCQLGKARTYLPLATMRSYSQKTDGGQMLYKQIWEAIVWSYVIEYSDFDVKKAYNSKLTTEGYHQGGLGNGVIGGTDLENYNNNEKFVPNDYTLEFGNNTGVKNRAAKGNQIAWDVPHWRGFNVFWYGDIWITLDNMLSKHDKQKIIWYYTDDVTKFSNDTSNKEHQIEGVSSNLSSNYLQELKINNKGDIVVSKITDNNGYKQSYYYIRNISGNNIICSGNRTGNSILCNIFSLDDSYDISYYGPEYGFVKVTILNT